MPEPTDQSPDPNKIIADWTSKQRLLKNAEWNRERTKSRLAALGPLENLKSDVQKSYKSADWVGWDTITTSPINGLVNAVGSTWNLTLGGKGPVPRFNSWSPAGKPTSIAGGVSEVLVQFGVGWIGGSKAIKTGRKWIDSASKARAERANKLGKGGKKKDTVDVDASKKAPSGSREHAVALLASLGKGAIVDFTVFDPAQGGTLGNFLIEQGKENGWNLAYPNFYKWVEDFSAIDPKEYERGEVAWDKDMANRFRQMKEGALLGFGVEGMMRIFKWSKFKSLENEYRKDIIRIQDSIENEKSVINISKTTATPEQAKNLREYSKALLVAQQRYIETIIKANDQGHLIGKMNLAGKRDSAGFISNSGWVTRRHKPTLSKTELTPEPFGFSSTGLDSTALNRFDVDTQQFLKDIGDNLQDTHNLKLRVGVPDPVGKLPKKSRVKKARGKKAKQQAAEDAEIRAGRKAIDLLPAESKDSAGTIFLNPDIVNNLWKEKSWLKPTATGSPSLQSRIKDIKGYGDQVFKDKDEFVDFLVQREILRSGSKGGGKKTLTEAQLDVMALNQINSRRAVKDLHSRTYTHTTSRAWKDPVVSVDFSRVRSMNHRGKLYEIDPDSGKILMDKAAIVRDFENGMLYLKGEAKDPLGYSITESSAASHNEYDILINTGIDPERLHKKFLQMGGEDGGAEVYSKFLELRARHILQIAERKGIKNLRELNPHHPDTRSIFTEATYKALGNSNSRGGLALGPINKATGEVDLSGLKGIEAEKVSPEGVFDRPSKVHELMWEEGGFKKFQDNLNRVRNGEISLDEALDIPEYWNKDFGGDMDATMIATIKTLEDGFSRVFPEKTYSEAAARARGWLGEAESGMTANQYALDKLEKEFNKYAAEYDIEDVGRLKEMMAKGEGIYAAVDGEGLRVIELPPDGDLSKLSLKDRFDMEARVEGTRVMVNKRLDRLNHMQGEIDKKLQDGTLTEKDKFLFTMEAVMFIDNIEALSVMRAYSGKNLRLWKKMREAAEDNDKYMDEAGQTEQYKKIMEQFKDSGLPSPEDMHMLISLQKADGLLNTHSKLSVALNRAKNLQKSLGHRDLMSAFNEVYINGLLSSLTTQAVNITSNMTFAYVSAIEGYIGSYIPHKLFKSGSWISGNAAPDLKNWVDQNSIEPRVAALMVRDKSWRKITYMTMMGLDVLRIFSKEVRMAAGGNNVMTLNAGNKRRMEETMDAWQKAWRSDEDPSMNLGGSQWDEGHNANAASSGKISAGIEKMFGNRLGKKAYQRLRGIAEAPFNKIGKSLGHEDGGQFIGELWDGFIKSVVRQPMRKLTLMDQLGKRIHLGAHFEGSLMSHAIHGLGMSSKAEVGEYIAAIKPHLMLANGDAFSKVGLKMEIRKRGKSLGYTGDQLQKYEQDQYDRLKHITWKQGAGDGEASIRMTVDERERLAQGGIEHADRQVFQGDLEGPSKILHANEVRISKAEGGSPPPPRETDISERASKWLAESPYWKTHIPFLKTPVHLQREWMARFPFLGFAHRNNRAALVSGNPDEIAQAYGRQMVGSALWAIAGMAAANGRITGSLEQSYMLSHDQAVTDKLAGRRRYTASFGEDIQVDFSRMEPFSFPLRMAADFADMTRILRNDSTEQALAKDLAHAAVAATWSASWNSTWSQGAADVMQGIAGSAKGYDGLLKLVTDVTHSMAPRVLRDFMDSMDSIEREHKMFWDKELKKVFPHGLPPMRDPILGRVLEDSQWLPNRFIKMINPMPIYKRNVHNMIYSELSSIHQSIGAMGPNLKGFDELPMARARANFEGIDADDTETKNLLALNYKLPADRGGASCPIRKGQDAYDWLMQYQSVRKVPRSSINIAQFGVAIPEDWPEAEREKMQGYLDAVEADIKSNKGRKKSKYIDLEEILYRAITVDADKSGKADYREKGSRVQTSTSGMSSERKRWLVSFVDKWRNDSQDEFIGDWVDGEFKVEGTPPVMVPTGIIADFWPHLAAGLSEAHSEARYSPPVGPSGPEGKIMFNLNPNVQNKLYGAGGGGFKGGGMRTGGDPQKRALEKIKELEKQNK